MSALSNPIGDNPAPLAVAPGEGTGDISDLLTIEEAAAITRSSYGVIYRAIRTKKLPFGRAGRRLVIKRSELLAWVMASQGPQRPPAASTPKPGVQHA